MVIHSVENKSFLVTGAASGLGAAYVEAFLEEGAKNVAVLDINEKVGKEFVEKLNKKYGSKAIFIKCNVANETDIDNAFEEVLEKFKRIDVIVNNAGIMNDTKTMWRTASEVNWLGVVSFTLKGITHMSKDKGGCGGTIINISSQAGFAKTAMLPIYCGSKSAVLHFSQTLADDRFFNRTGIRVLTLCLGATNTALVQGLEVKGIDEQTGKDYLSSAVFKVQKVESAVATLMTMYKEGANRAVYLAINDKPPQDISPVIENVYKEFRKLLTIETE